MIRIHTPVSLESEVSRFKRLGQQRTLNKGHPTRISRLDPTAFCSLIIIPEVILRPQTSSGCRAYSQVILDYYPAQEAALRENTEYRLFVWYHTLILLSLFARNAIVYHPQSKYAKKTLYRCRRLWEITWRASIMSKGPSSTPSIYFEMPSP